MWSSKWWVIACILVSTASSECVPIELEFSISRVPTPRVPMSLLNTLSKRDTWQSDIQLDLLETQTFYRAKVQVGSAQEPIDLLIDTGSCSTWVMAKDVECFHSSHIKVDKRISRRDDVTVPPLGEVPVGDTPNAIQERSPVNRPLFSEPMEPLNQVDSQKCKRFGSFDGSHSSTFQEIPTLAPFHIKFSDKTFATGIWGHDTMTFGGIEVPQTQFGVVQKTDNIIGILGLGSDLSKKLKAEKPKYPDDFQTFPRVLQKKGLVKRAIFSLFLDEPTKRSGSVIFGAVDHAKYHGTLQTVRFANFYDKISSKPLFYDVQLDSISVKEAGKSKINIPIGLIALLDSGSTLCSFSEAVLTPLADALGGVWHDQVQLYEIDRLAIKNIHVSFWISSIKISIPAPRLVIRIKGVDYLAVSLEPRERLILGEEFLRHAYVVFDPERNEVSMAQARYTTEKDVELVTGDIPRAVRATKRQEKSPEKSPTKQSPAQSQNQKPDELGVYLMSSATEEVNHDTGSSKKNVRFKDHIQILGYEDTLNSVLSGGAVPHADEDNNKVTLVEEGDAKTHHEENIGEKSFLSRISPSTTLQQVSSKATDMLQPSSEEFGNITIDHPEIQSDVSLGPNESTGETGDPETTSINGARLSRNNGSNQEKSALNHYLMLISPIDFLSNNKNISSENEEVTYDAPLNMSQGTIDMDHSSIHLPASVGGENSNTEGFDEEEGTLEPGEVSILKANTSNNVDSPGERFSGVSKTFPKVIQSAFPEKPNGIIIDSKSAKSLDETKTKWSDTLFFDDDEKKDTITIAEINEILRVLDEEEHAKTAPGEAANLHTSLIPPQREWFHYHERLIQEIAESSRTFKRIRKDTGYAKRPTTQVHIDPPETPKTPEQYVESHSESAAEAPKGTVGIHRINEEIQDCGSQNITGEVLTSPKQPELTTPVESSLVVSKAGTMHTPSSFIANTWPFSSTLRPHSTEEILVETSMVPESALKHTKCDSGHTMATTTDYSSHAHAPTGISLVTFSPRERSTDVRSAYTENTATTSKSLDLKPTQQYGQTFHVDKIYHQQKAPTKVGPCAKHEYSLPSNNSTLGISGSIELPMAMSRLSPVMIPLSQHGVTSLITKNPICNLESTNTSYCIIHNAWGNSSNSSSNYLSGELSGNASFDMTNTKSEVSKVASTKQSKSTEKSFVDFNSSHQNFTKNTDLYLTTKHADWGDSVYFSCGANTCVGYNGIATKSHTNVITKWTHSNPKTNVTLFPPTSNITTSPTLSTDAHTSGLSITVSRDIFPSHDLSPSTDQHKVGSDQSVSTFVRGENSASPKIPKYLAFTIMVAFCVSLMG